jgi:hypothetical protein
MPQEMHGLLIKLNRRLRHSDCAVCDQTSELNIGPELFTADGRYVCAGCGAKTAPELTALLGVAAAAERYVAFLFEMGDQDDVEDRD